MEMVLVKCLDTRTKFWVKAKNPYFNWYKNDFLGHEVLKTVEVD
jgi:hypothetical protein